jgi:hypothetical protein
MIDRCTRSAQACIRTITDSIFLQPTLDASIRITASLCPNPSLLMSRMTGGAVVSCSHTSLYPSAPHLLNDFFPAPAPDASYAHIPIQAENRTQRENPELSTEDLLITSPILMGFSLSDKLWCEYLSHKIMIPYLPYVQWSLTSRKYCRSSGMRRRLPILCSPLTGRCFSSRWWRRTMRN